MELPEELIHADKIVGYFAQTPHGIYFGISLGKILVADTEEKLLQYLDDHNFEGKIKIKTISFASIATKINDGCSFVFDRGSFAKFARIAELNLIDDVLLPDVEDENTFIACISVLDQVSNSSQIH